MDRQRRLAEERSWRIWREAKAALEAKRRGDILALAILASVACGKESPNAAVIACDDAGKDAEYVDPVPCPADEAVVAPGLATINAVRPDVIATLGDDVRLLRFGGEGITRAGPRGALARWDLQWCSSTGGLSQHVGASGCTLFHGCVAYPSCAALPDLLSTFGAPVVDSDRAIALAFPDDPPSTTYYVSLDAYPPHGRWTISRMSADGGITGASVDAVTGALTR